jgi:CheY-like chemotaxis protein
MTPKAILIADDNPADIVFVKLVLNEANVLNPIRSVESGDKTISYLKGEGNYADRNLYPFPMLVFLDLKMPKTSGTEVLEWFRFQPEYQEVGIVAITGVHNLQEVRQAYQLGAHSFLIKPFWKEDLMNLLNGLKGIRLESRPGGYYLDFDMSNFRVC